MSQQIGPYRIEVIKPFRELRLICDADDYGIGFDLVYRSEYGPISEPQDAQYILDHTEGVVGFYGASSVERDRKTNRTTNR